MRVLRIVAVILAVCFAGCRMPPLKRVPSGPVTKYDALVVAIEMHDDAAGETNPLKKEKKLKSRDECFNSWLNWRHYRFARLEKLANAELERQRIMRFLADHDSDEGLPIEYRRAISRALLELNYEPAK